MVKEYKIEWMEFGDGKQKHLKAVIISVPVGIICNLFSLVKLSNTFFCLHGVRYVLPLRLNGRKMWWQEIKENFPSKAEEKEEEIQEKFNFTKL